MLWGGEEGRVGHGETEKLWKAVSDLQERSRDGLNLGKGAEEWWEIENFEICCASLGHRVEIAIQIWARRSKGFPWYSIHKIKNRPVFHKVLGFVMYRCFCIPVALDPCPSAD